MILWKQSFEITSDMKREKGHNYKEREIGPFIRLCNKCKKNTLEYKTYESMNGAERQDTNCAECTKKLKGKSKTYSRKCSNENCNNFIFYKTIYGYKDGMKNNTKCRECRNKHLSNYYKDGGIHKYKTNEERKKINYEITLKREKYYKSHPDELQELIERRKNPKATFYIVKNIKCQGANEKQYIEMLASKNECLPTKPKGVLTNYGYYFPDFEFDDRYVEIKSIYTYSILKNENNKQYLKIKEVSKIKPVEIIVNSTKTGEILFTEFLDNSIDKSIKQSNTYN